MLGIAPVVTIQIVRWAIAMQFGWLAACSFAPQMLLCRDPDPVLGLGLFAQE